MNKNDLTKIVRLLLVDSSLLDEQSKLDTKDNLFELGMDSIEIIKLIYQIEMNFGIQLSPEDMSYDNLYSVNQLYRLINRLKKQI